MVAHGGKEYLGLTLESAEGVAVEYAVTVTLEFCTVGALFLISVTLCAFLVNA